jgi:hypothetical protein
MHEGACMEENLQEEGKDPEAPAEETEEDAVRRSVKEKFPWLDEKSPDYVQPPGDAKKKDENWTRGNKDQLLFERLIEKWIK